MAISLKNYALTPPLLAATSLGLGDLLKQQVDDNVDEMKKQKLGAAANTNPGAYGDMSLGTAASMLFSKKTGV